VDTVPNSGNAFYVMENNGKLFIDGYYSTNDGANWVKFPGIGGGSPPYRILHLNGDSLLCMGYIGSICFSSNNGASWEVWNNGAVPAGGIRNWEFIDRTIWANDGSGLGNFLRSDNLGKSFSGVTTDLAGTEYTGVGDIRK